MRQVVLGGELKGRGFGGRTVPEFIVLASSVLVGFLFAVSQEVVDMITGALLIVSGFILTYPGSIFRGRTPLALLTHSTYSGFRSITKNDQFDPEAVDKRGNPIATAPLMIGDVKGLDLWFDNEQLVYLMRHQGSPSFYTVIFEVEGMEESTTEDEPYISWGQVQARAAERTSAVTHIQSLARSVPIDMTDHLLWLADYISPDAPDSILRSYQDLSESVREHAEMHRSYVVVRLDSSAALARATVAAGNGTEGTYAAVIRESKSLMDIAVQLGAIRKYRPLDSSLAKALIRHLQNPGFDIDDTNAVDNPWLPYNRRDSKVGIRFGDGPLTRVGYIPRDGFESAVLSVHTLRRLVSGIYPPVPHTISWVNALSDAKQARQKAKRHVTSDRAKKSERTKKGIVSDGTDEVLENASQQRLLDLKPGTGHHGADWAAYISYSANSVDQLLEIANTIESVANGAGVKNIEWLDQRRDLALSAVLPLGRGIRR